MAIQYTELSIQVYQVIKNKILNNELKPGDKIPQEAIANELGISRMPLHKAFQMLENEMLVESIPRRGVFVKAMNDAEIIDAFACREGLEGIAARLTAENRTDEQFETLKALFTPFENRLAAEHAAAYQAADQKFHHLIIEYSQNKILPRIEFLGNIHIICYNRGLIRPPHETWKEHMDIINAIERQNGKQAEYYVKDHLRKSRETMMKNQSVQS